uniref:RxLR effector protein n=1 Tax=Chromera velia CCMP2878 TaxID=1169474 RepID=A0A0G4HLV7_9ALVE|eukprot:Cvel_28877.t1-p1 / transcript=Cvel_28877.t1 / gene=Cvel_28877 / organism=Chromera_velia_CCMP2878 / gene_product=hypothetical protein / transcript_product=hypothetical protein / location=Cvel_scaffold3860:621-1253(-) / protein_length=139 / sequence_SO=supercontig / SO=protein_coding / is_pseudo=false
MKRACALLLCPLLACQGHETAQRRLLGQTDVGYLGGQHKGGPTGDRVTDPSARLLQEELEEGQHAETTPTADPTLRVEAVEAEPVSVVEESPTVSPEGDAETPRASIAANQTEDTSQPVQVRRQLPSDASAEERGNGLF